MTVKHKRDYLYMRSASQFWRVRFRENGVWGEKSLGTTDRAQAEILALPFIAAHKQRLLENKPKLVPSYSYKFPQGEHKLPNGGRVIATDETAIHIEADGKVWQETNRIPGLDLVNIERTTFDALKSDTFFDLPAYIEKVQHPALPKPAMRSDDSILQAYIDEKKLSGQREREVCNVWGLFKTLVKKPLKDCDRADGRKLVAHFEERGLKTSSIHRTLVPLNAAVNLAVKDGKLKFNPFAGIVAKTDNKSLDVQMLDEADMALCAANLGKLSKEDALLFRLLAATGMRLGEAVGIAKDERVDGIRFATVGTKTDASKRRVPFPACVLPYLPEKITGRLFWQGDANAMSKRLNKWLDEIGIHDEAKRVHSLRHRAKYRLKLNDDCPPRIQDELLGHKKPRNEGDNYGDASPLPKLRKWIDTVGGV